MKPIALTLLCAAALLHAEDYTLGPDSQPQPGVPKGAVTKHKLPAGRYYPGTPHDYAIYVPAQYTSSTPTAFMVFLDGSGSLKDTERVPTVFDNLIAKHDLPPMIGIFVDPGVLPAINPQAQSRFERVFEYDSLSDRFSSFLIEELIPAVAKNYNLSKDPNDHGIFGVSTGAVGAFAAAWNRPDQFRRVLSLIGTFVAMKGADSLPGLIRRTEPKPIRIFLQAGKKDHVSPAEPWGTFYAGSWPVNNRLMYEAFQYAGYDAKLVIGEEGHNRKHGDAILPDAFRWLWRGYPSPIVAKEPAAMNNPDWDSRGRVFATIYMDKPWQQVGETYQSVSSPTGDVEGNVYFADPAANRIYKSDPDGKVTVFKQNTGGVRALAMGGIGRLYAAQPGRKRIVWYGPSGEEHNLASNVEAASLAVTIQHAVYYADPLHKAIGYIDPQGASHVAYKGDNLALPSAVALSPDQAMLIVADAQSRFSWSFQIAADGSLTNGEPFYRLEMPEQGWMSGTQSVMEDSIGQVYFATAAGIQVCEANGRVAMILNAPERGAVTSIAFAGKDQSWLYAAQNGRLFRRPAKVKGVPSWAKAALPKPPL